MISNFFSKLYSRPLLLFYWFKLGLYMMIRAITRISQTYFLIARGTKCGVN